MSMVSGTRRRTQQPPRTLVRAPGSPATQGEELVMTAAVRVVAAGPVWPAAAAWEMGRVMREADGWADFAEFVTAAMPGLLRYGHALTGNPHDAADLVQGVLEKV